MQIEWPDIDAFIRRSGVWLSPWEIELIEDLDDLFLRSLAEDDGIEGAAVSSPASDGEGVKDIVGAVSPLGRKTVVRKVK